MRLPGRNEDLVRFLVATVPETEPAQALAPQRAAADACTVFVTHVCGLRRAGQVSRSGNLSTRQPLYLHTQALHTDVLHSEALSSTSTCAAHCHCSFYTEPACIRSAELWLQATQDNLVLAAEIVAALTCLDAAENLAARDFENAPPGKVNLTASVFPPVHHVSKSQERCPASRLKTD